MVSVNFITKRTDHHYLIYKSQKIAVTSSFEGLDKYLESVSMTGYDLEFNTRRLYDEILLLASVGETGNLFVVDLTCMLEEFVVVMTKHADRVRFVGHNLQADLTVGKQAGLWFPIIWDTMIAEQRLNMGMLGVSNSLEATYQRRLKAFMPEDKETRKEFMSMDKSSSFSLKQIMYSGGDTERICEIAHIQRELLIQRAQFNFVRDVECNLVHILTEMKMDGVYLDEAKWTKMIFNKQVAKLNVEKIMDAEVARLTGTRLKDRKRGEYVLLDMFGQHKEVENVNKKHINYSSSPQVLKVFKTLNQKLPVLVSKGKTTNSTKEEALQAYLLESPHTPLRLFIETLIEYRGYQKLITSYGKKFFRTEVRKKGGKVEAGFKNQFTGLVHTIYKQCFTDTGRLASGDAKAGLFNSQNIVRDKEVRECFGLTPAEIEAGWWITTCDLTGAELIIMAALADDQHLYELGADKIGPNGEVIEGDLHSPLATKSWRAVYKYREAHKREMVIQDTLAKKYILTEDFEVNKQTNKMLRTDFKRMGFGVVYGLKPNKGSQTLNIPKDEAAVVIDVICNEIPKTIRMVEDAAMCAFADGYVIFNKKTNNRRWFSPVLGVLSQLKGNYTRAERYKIVKETLDFKTASEIEGEARNCRIQGTQADMLKEAMVRIKQYAVANKIEMRFIFTVHDELVIKHKDKAFGAVIAQLMKETANSYLALYSDNIRMGASFETLHTWTK